MMNDDARTGANEGTGADVPAFVSSADSDVSGLRNPFYVGSKAAGLFSLPKEWVPPFVVLSSSFAQLFSESITASFAGTDALQLLDNVDRERLADLFVTTPIREPSTMAGGEATSTEDGASLHAIVRSNGAHENIEMRGQSRSKAASTLNEISHLVTNLLRTTLDERPLIQHCIEPAIVGHMSNERRLSERAESWVVEGLLSNDGMPIRISAAKTNSAVMTLGAFSETEVLRALRVVARFLMRRSRKRYHVEWVWDSRRVWIVQVDEDLPSRTDAYVRESLSTLSRPDARTTTHFALLKHYKEMPDAEWRKLRVPREFSKLGFPTADIYLLPGDIYAGSSYDDLKNDLARFGAVVVVRTDLKPGSSVDAEFLATSDPYADVNEHIRFMEAADHQFRTSGIPDSNWTFLVAPLVPARASAMVRALPGSPTVQVDALWGFPDGLSYFPCDTYEFKRIGKANQVRLLKKRHKPYGLFISNDQWSIGRIGEPYDWERVLDDQEVATLGSWAARIADVVGKQIQLMAFARIGGNRGAAACLPFHYTTFDIKAYPASRITSPVDRRMPIVSSWETLSRIAEKPLDAKSGVLLSPEPGTLRDTSFLKSVARLSKEHGVPIYFRGSLQGHAYYVLTSNGAAVVAVDAVDAPGDVTVYKKLVRDHIPAIVKRAGGIPRVRLLRGSEAKLLLSQKLIEEAHEVWNADAGELAGELADIMDVVDALMQSAGITEEQFITVRENKKRQRGGFRDMVYLEETEFRPFSAAVRKKGELPLLIDDEAAAGVATRGFSRFSFSVDEESAGTVMRLAIGLIPPVEGSQKLRSLSQHDGRWEALLSFWPTSIELIIAPLRIEESKQMSLFGEIGEEP